MYMVRHKVNFTINLFSALFNVSDFISHHYLGIKYAPEALGQCVGFLSTGNGHFKSTFLSVSALIMHSLETYFIFLSCCILKSFTSQYIFSFT